jgi:hypothetical protein
LGKLIWNIILTLLISMAGIAVVHAQDRFNGTLILGLNASQIDGDLLAGYDKLGLTGGVKLDYRLEKPWYLSLELLYSARGSQSELIADASLPLRKISLQYIEMPLLLRYRDWWIEEESYYKVDAEAGISYGYLFNSSSSQGSFTWQTDDFRTNDIGFILGAHYFISKHWGFGVRYTRSITRLYINPETDERDLLGYFLSFRSLFQF